MDEEVPSKLPVVAGVYDFECSHKWLALQGEEKSEHYQPTKLLVRTDLLAETLVLHVQQLPALLRVPVVSQDLGGVGPICRGRNL